MSDYLAHLADRKNPNYTACGEPWQGWQAPDTERFRAKPGNITLPPHDEPTRRSQIRQCQACAGLLRRNHSPDRSAK